MAVDRGGLQYTIRLRDEFSKTTGKFKSEMRASKAAFAEFSKGVAAQRESAASFRKTSQAMDEQKAVLKRLSEASKKQTALEREAVRIRNTQQQDATRAIRERLAVEKRAAAERKQLLQEEQRNLKALVDSRNRSAKEAQRLEEARRKDEAKALIAQQRQLKDFADARTKAEKQAARISQSMKKDQAAKNKADPAFQAQQRLNQALREETIQRKQIALLRARAQSQFTSGDLLGGSKSIKQAKELEKSLKGVDKAGNSIFFTFRRLVGILAVFTIARNVVQGFNDLVKAGIEFNDKVESATTSIAGLLVAVTDVRNQFGQSVTPAEELSLAMKSAQDQVKKLRQDALQTVATFEQLLDTFQVAVAPGFAAGLNLDEIRKLTVSISQAASAIGVEQNQLAEEVRSLLSGTIQARTTRIATALGITNADIRRLKETGELFDFLEDKFSGFALSAQQQAKRTLAGIGTLIKGATSELLGKAAKPLFDELIQLGNEFFDKILTIKDAEGNLKPNPQVVEGFKQIFEALRSGVQEIKSVAKDIGFEGFQNAFKAAGTALVVGIKFAIGFAETLLKTLNLIVVAVQSIADTFGITTQALGRLAGALGVVIASTVIWNNTLGLLGVNFTNIKALALKIGPAIRSIAVGPVGLLAAALGIVLVGFNKIAESIFGVDLGIRDTIELLATGLLGTLIDIGAFFQVLGHKIANGISELFNGLIEGAIRLKTELKILAASITGDTKEIEALTSEQLQIEADQNAAASKRRKAFELEIADIRSQAEAKSLGINQAIADIIGKAAGESAKGAGFDPTIDPTKFDQTAQAAEDFTGVISSADSAISGLSETLQELDDELFKTGEEFRVLFGSPALEGIGGKIQDIFSDAAVKNAEKLRKLRSSLNEVEQSISDSIADQGTTAERLAQIQAAATTDLKDRQAALKALNLTAGEAQLISLLRDQVDIRDSLRDAEQKSLDLALRKAAIVALQETPAIEKELILQRAQLASEQALTQVAAARLGSRRQAVVEAQNALNIAREEAKLAQETAQAEINSVGSKAALASGDEQQALFALLAALEEKLGIEKSISDEKLRQLELVKSEAALVESGTIDQGLRRGFEQVAKDLPSAFEAGVEIVRQSTQQLASFISESIVTAFDPTNDTTLLERFARFLQSIAQIILQQIVQLAIASAIQKALGETQAGTIEIASATTAASIKVTAATTAASIELASAQAAAAIRAASGGFGFHSGGLVKGYNKGGRVAGRGKASPAHAWASGYAMGGLPARPAGLHPSDTVPAWLQPGEFVMRKSVVDSLGLDFFQAVNSGSFGVSDAAPPSGAGAAKASGFAKGGLVSDQLQRAAVNRSAGGQEEVTVLPVQVTGEKQLDRLLAGGKAASRRFLQDNASIIRSIAKGG